MAAYGLSEEMHARIAEQLYHAEKDNEPIPLLTKEYPVITFHDTYAIQQAGLKLREAEGVRVIGRKIGITSKGMMAQLECNSPDYGYLLDTMQLPENGSCDCSALHLPRIEGELAFLIGKDIQGGFITPSDVCDATEKVMPCFEIVDTRYEGWNFTVRDTICDNAAAARFMVSSDTKNIQEINPATICLSIEKNGQEVGRAPGSEILESSPVASVVWLANRLIEHGDCLKAGDIVLSGAFMGGYPVELGDTFILKMDGFTPLSISFV